MYIDNIQLTVAQKQLFDIVLKASSNDPLIHALLYGGRGTGKSIIFEYMDNYFSNVLDNGEGDEIFIGAYDPKNIFPKDIYEKIGNHVEYPYTKAIDEIMADLPTE